MHNYENFYKIDEVYKVIECKDCGFYHVYPYPDSHFLDNFYSKQYKDELSKINLAEKVARVKNLTKKSEIIDIGCGDGTLMEEFKKADFSAYGIEPSEICEEECIKKGLAVRRGFCDINPFEKKFEIVNLSYSLEHIPNPAHFIEDIKDKFLTDDGFICIEIPNDFNLLQMVYAEYHQEEPYWIHFPDHLNYWNFDTFKKFIVNAGFDIIHYTSSFPLEMFLLMGDDYIKNKELGKVMHQKRVAFENKLKNVNKTNTMFDIYTKLSEMNIGREIQIIVKRR
jgi:SAM-dependent methyltransferase